MQTYTGVAFDLQEPDVYTVVLEDVATALAQIVRFTGHCKGAYTVAQHSVLIARALRDEGHTEGVQRAGLLHDAHEAYTGDVATPIKRAVGDPWTDFEARIARVVRTRFRVPHTMPKAVYDMDARMLMSEARDLMGRPPAPWGIDAQPYPEKITPWSMDRAKQEFLEHCTRLDIY